QQAIGHHSVGPVDGPTARGESDHRPHVHAAPPGPGQPADQGAVTEINILDVDVVASLVNGLIKGVCQLMSPGPRGQQAGVGVYRAWRIEHGGSRIEDRRGRRARNRVRSYCPRSSILDPRSSILDLTALGLPKLIEPVLKIANQGAGERE